MRDRRAENGGQKDRAEERECKDEISVGQTASRDLEQQKRETTRMKRILIAAVLTSALAVASAANASQYCGACSYSCCPHAVLSADVLLHGLPRRTPDVLPHGVRHGLRAAAVHGQPDLL